MQKSLQDFWQIFLCVSVFAYLDFLIKPQIYNGLVIIYVTVVTLVRDVVNYVTVVLGWIRLSVTFEDLL